MPRKGRPPEKLMFPWNSNGGFERKGFPFRELTYANLKGGRTICVITDKDGKKLVGSTDCSCSQIFYEDSGEDIALNRANLKRGHVCAYCHIINEK